MMQQREYSYEELFGGGQSPAPAQAPPVAAVDPDTDALVRTVWGEARNQDATGRKAVASVIRNRARMTSRPVSEVVLEPGQFEPWGDPDTRAQLEALDPASPDYQAILADIQGDEDPTGGATHFYAPKAQEALGRDAPSWDDGTGVDIGDHRFFSLPYGGAEPAGGEQREFSYEELFGDSAPMTEDVEVAELVVEGAPPGERERIFQPIKDFWEPLSSAGREAGRDIASYYRAETNPDRGLADALPTMAKAGNVLLAPLKIVGGLAEGVANQVTGPLGRLAARSPLPVYGPTAYGEMPVPLEGEARGEAFTDMLNTAASGARALPRMGPPRPPNLRASRGERRVGSVVERAISRDQLTPDMVRQNLAADPDLPAFQAGGENLRATADVMAQVPGEANVTLRRAARDSQAKAPSRIREEIGRTFDATGNYFAKVDEMKAARKAAAEPYRERAFTEPVGAVDYAEKVAPLIARAPKSAVSYAAEIARRDGRNPADIGFEVSPASGDIPEMVRVSRPTMETLHYIKKGMDQELEQYRTALGTLDTTGNPLAGATAKLRSEYARALRDVNPDYDKYMQIWGDESGQIEALRLGREAFSGKQGVNAEQLRKKYGEMSQAEQDEYRLGLGEALFDMVNRRGVQAARQVLKSDEFKDRVRVAVPDETSYNEFVSALERQVVIQDRNTSIATGSPTAYRQAARADLEQQQGVSGLDIAGGALDMATAPIRTVAGKAAKAALDALPRRDRSLVGDPQLNAALGRALSDPEEMKRILDLMEAQRTSRANSSRAALRASLPLLALPSPQGQQTGP
ncbi:cell wall hydrolase [Phenylobacterium sp.]|uniref:cell wall hydrolase n=1 Tax=Phenylobacterium sp. TaxID=1871053 RepID=UPI002609B5A6|nr:cell wall hydrolase [Phenylobacterium sp.]